ncbi:MAG: DUF1553 domain-containing protein [Chthoniobacteraceae bacterium]
MNVRIIALTIFIATRLHAVDFVRDVRPILAERCFECHGEKKQKANLRLDRKADALKGSDDGPVIVSGKSAESALIERVLSHDEGERMPPKGERLTAAQIATLRTWIDAGAPWPDERDTRLDHWAWQPVKRPAGDSIDAFIVAKLAQAGLAMSPEADRRTLIRRLSFDLLGLPPTPERVERFVNDPDPRAYEKLVDEMLASPHYGERWARHWLDIAHYADTHGFERDKLRPNAWRYRDYVIRALNADKPYDRFLREQIAGDALRPDDPEAVIATGFLAAGPWDFVGQAETKSDVLKRAARADDLDDMVTQVMTAACGVTINCARCHDHKLDPITQREYYALWAVFAGVKRDDRDVNAAAAARREEAGKKLQARLREVRGELGRLTGEGLDLADMIGGGDGRGSGTKGAGLHIRTGNVTTERLGYHRDIMVNRLQAVQWSDPQAPKFVQWLFVPDGTSAARVAYNVETDKLPATSGHAWDVVRNGPLNAQVNTKIDGVDYAGDRHSILGLHANGGVTFALAEVRKATGFTKMRFTAMVGFGAKPEVAASRADFSVFVDGELKFQRLKMRKDESARVDVEIPANAKWLALVATDGGDGIGSDLLFLGDARLLPESGAHSPKPVDRERIAALRAEETKLTASLAASANDEKVYAVTTSAPPEIKVLRRGDPETPTDGVGPGVFRLAGLRNEFAGDDAQRRIALADWITDRANPLTRRVLVNRLWHYHFGTGIVDTPSDFGLGGGMPSHPELLDWLAEEFAASGWSLKSMHRLICTSAAYRQVSQSHADGLRIDSGGRLLWRMNPRRLDAESLRDAMLAVSGKLNPQMFGPGYRDFDYEEAYAPIYRYITPDSPELWRRSVYRFVVRTTTHQFMTTLDCPNPANLTPARNVTTTALQSLALMNNEFVIKQAGYFAERVERDAGAKTEAQVARAFHLAFSRSPSPDELSAAGQLVRSESLSSLCRMLLNANEFIYVD